ncbi:MAG: hypothetical protein ACI841_002828 [Planctomycetota bacterium]|jgi:hypothetical protein
MQNRFIFAIGTGALLFLLQGCDSSSSGGTTSTTVEGLEAPDQVSLVNASEEDEVVASGGIAPGSNSFPADADYNTDDARAWVYDPSMEALDQVNNILCYMAMTAYDEMVNEDTYIAQIDDALCQTGEGGGAESSDSGQSSGSNGEEFMYFTVNSTRENNKSAQINEIWVPEEDGFDGPQTIYVRMTIDEGATDENPTGDFNMSFAGAADYADLDEPIMSGAIASLDTTDAMGYQFFETMGDLDEVHSPGDFSRETSLTVSMNEEQTDGSARIRVRERHNFGGDSGIDTSEWLVSFNETHFKRQQGEDDPVTLSRDEFNTTVWRYNLYYADGDDAGNRVDLNSGFPFVTEEGEFGWAGYYGIWAPDHIDLPDGATVFEQHFGDDSAGEAYTVVQAPGRLIKSERHQLDLDDLVGQSLQYWDWQNGEQYQVEFMSGAFYTVAMFDNETLEWTELETPEEIDAEASGGFLGFWSDSLGGPVNWVDGDDFVTFFEESFVTGADAVFDDVVGGELELFGFFEALNAELTAADVENGDIFLEDSWVVESPHEYVFDANDLTLYFDENGDGSSMLQVGLADGETPQGGPYNWGMRSGPMVIDTSELNEVHEIWDIEVYYSYETGHNPWNKFSALMDSTDTYVAFDAPLQFLYTHTEDTDRNESTDYDGASFFFEYNGEGNLHGIPWVAGDFEGADDFERWFPAFNIADGTVMGPNGTEFVIKAIEMEQTLAADEDGSAGLSLSGATALTLPDDSLYEVPDIGEMPDVTDPPAVINGEVQVDESDAVSVQ